MKLVKTLAVLSAASFALSSTAFAASSDACKFGFKVGASYISAERAPVRAESSAEHNGRSLLPDATSPIPADSFIPQRNAEYKRSTGAAAKFGLSYYITDAFSIGAEYSYQPSLGHTDHGYLPKSKDGQKVKNKSHIGMMNAKYEFITSNGLNPFVSTGIGYEKQSLKIKGTGHNYFSDSISTLSDNDDNVILNNKGLKAKKSGLRAKLGGGIGYKVGNMLLEMSYHASHIAAVGKNNNKLHYAANTSDGKIAKDANTITVMKNYKRKARIGHEFELAATYIF